MTIPAFTVIPNSVTSPTTFDDDIDTWLSEVNAWGTAANALAAALNSVAAGGALTIPYTFSTTTTDADPGAGFLRLDNATQASATTIRADLVGADTTTYTDMLLTFDDSTSTIKGYIMLQSLTTPTRWLLYSVSALASPSGYKNITVAYVAGAGGLTNNESITLKFTRNADDGATGATGAAGVDGSPKYLSTVTASASATVDVETTFDSTYDEYVIKVTDLVPAIDRDALKCLMKIGGLYITTNTYLFNCQTLNTSGETYTALGTSGGATNHIKLCGEVGSAAGEGMTLTMYISNPASTTMRKNIHGHGVSSDGAATEIKNATFFGGNTGTDALTGIRFSMNGGNITSGSFRLYGIKKS